MNQKNSENTSKVKCAPLNLFKAMQSDSIEYVYIGEFTTSITDSILSLAELNLETSNDSIKLKKRVYFILVEGLQNITRHQQYDPEYAPYSGLLVIQRINDTFIITTANYVLNSDVEKLKKHIDKINSLEPEQLKKYYREVLAQQHFSTKGGAGLGLIEIVRKSNNKLLYSFEKVDGEYSLFYLQTKISLPGSENNVDFSIQSLNRIKLIHQYFIKCHVVLSFAGIFMQDKLVYMLSILEKRMNQDYVLRSKLFNIIVELLQNIVRHADDFVFENIAGHYAIFYIAEDSEYLYVTTGNYIRKEKIPKLKEKLDFINRLSIKELTKQHYNILKAYKETGSINDNLGLGLLDIRIKSRQKINYFFEEVNDEFEFFSVQVKLRKVNPNIENLHIKETQATPEIYLSAKEAKFYIRGYSFPINAMEFYKPVFDWLKEYGKNPRNFTVFQFQIDSFNTPSEKAFIEIFNILDQINKNSVVVVKWYCRPEDDGSLEFYHELKQLYPNLDIQLIQTEDLTL